MLCKLKNENLRKSVLSILPHTFDSASYRIVTKSNSSNDISDCLLKDLTFKYLNETLKHRLYYDLTLHVWSLFSSNNICCLV